MEHISSVYILNSGSSKAYKVPTCVYSSIYLVCYVARQLHTRDLLEIVDHQHREVTGLLPDWEYRITKFNRSGSLAYLFICNISDIFKIQ